VSSLQDFLRYCRELLKKNGVDAPELSAEVIFSFSLGMSRLELLISDLLLSREEKSRIMTLIKRRCRGEPLAYLVGEKEFFGLSFKVTPATLIPRPETETLVEVVLDLYPRHAPLVFADCGAGCGNICITLLKILPCARAVATDLSQEALYVLKENSALHRVTERLLMVQTDLLSCVKRASLDLVVSNPPYLSPLFLENIQESVVEFEPSLALFGGEMGHETPAKLLNEAWEVLRRGGYLVMELDRAQLIAKEEVFSLSQGWHHIRVYKDLMGNDRVLVVRKM